MYFDFLGPFRSRCVFASPSLSASRKKKGQVLLCCEQSARNYEKRFHEDSDAKRPYRCKQRRIGFLSQLQHVSGSRPSLSTGLPRGTGVISTPFYVTPRSTFALPVNTTCVTKTKTATKTVTAGAKNEKKKKRKKKVFAPRLKDRPPF